MNKTKTRICSECGKPYEPHKYDARGTFCYREACQAALKEKKRLNNIRLAREWRKRQKEQGIKTVRCSRCRNYIPEKLIVKLTDRAYCPKCYGIVSNVFAYDVVYETGGMINEVAAMFQTGPQMEYGRER